MRFRKFLFPALTALLVLTACGKKNTSTSTTETSPSATTPSLSSSSPNSSASSVKSESKTSGSKSLAKFTQSQPNPDPEGKFIEVKIGNLETYNYKTGLFQIDAPKDWQPSDKSKPGEAIVLWYDPSKNSFLNVDIFKSPNQASSDQLTPLLQNFLKSSLGTKSDFAMEAPVTQPDGSVRIVWSFVETVGSRKARILGNSFIEPKGDKVSVLNIGVLEPQFDKLQDSLTKVVNSYKVNPSIQVP